MRDASFYASGLIELSKVAADVDRRAKWRQSMAALAGATEDDGPSPLEGLKIEALVAGVRGALQAGFVDELDWLAPPAAGAALFELAAALPVGPEQRELGRRVLARLMAGDAATFVAIARRMALSTGKGLGSAAVHTRVALVAELPIGAGISDGPLALAIVARRELAREWIAQASTGALPSRRLAARLIERAAREAARRAALGDEHNVRVFRSDALGPAWRRLLADRESLVWRHVAVARGLLARWEPAFATAIEEGLSPEMSPTEWRRAAASVSAHVAVAPDAALALAIRALSTGLLVRDPGAASAFIWGLARAAEAEGEAAGELLESVMERAQGEIGEAVLELRSELGPGPLVTQASELALRLLAKRGRSSGDDGHEALAQDVAHDLAEDRAGGLPLRDQIAAALGAYVTSGAKEAQARAREALGAAQATLKALEAVSPADDVAGGGGETSARRASMVGLRDLDLSLLERDVLGRLLALGGGDSAKAADEAIDPLRERLGEWLLAREARPLTPEEGSRLAHPTMSLRRLRALLHLVDCDAANDDTDPPRAARLRGRWLRITRALLERFEHGPPSVLRRTVIAALGRSFDALVRVGACDVVDVLLVAAGMVHDPLEIATLGEASMDPDLVHVLQRYTRFAVVVVENEPGALGAFEELTREIAPDASGRIEALRTVLVRIAGALRAIAAAGALRDLAPTSGGEPEALAALEAGLAALSHLTEGARGRLVRSRPSIAPGSTASARPLTVAVARVLSGADPVIDPDSVTRAIGPALASLPVAIRTLVRVVTRRLATLPLDGSRPSLPTARVQDSLPGWLPVARTIGGFYVLRALGAGAVGSVFVVTRLEDRQDPTAERLALKVPEYSASAARSLSEAEFLKMFRDEASALIALPQHPNLARFVTFDAGSKPKPILVMEFVEGTTLERLITTGGLDVTRAFRALDDMLRGLEAMHAVGVAHLDIKPSNVVLRRSEEAVLVDFGLAGRHLRPGCATGAYGAPEVWGAFEGQDVVASPSSADVYAFGCVAFETLMGKTLFDADSEVTQVAMHIAHDGSPPALERLRVDPRLGPLVEILRGTLRRDPRKRWDAKAVREALAEVSAELAGRKWPLEAA